MNVVEIEEAILVVAEQLEKLFERDTKMTSAKESV